MFRYSLNSALSEIRKHENIANTQNSLLFVPSNAIVPSNMAPIIFQDSLMLKKWGFLEDESNPESKIVSTISLEDVLSNHSLFQYCIIPLNGYFLNAQYFSVYRYSQKDNLIFSAGVITENDSFLFVTITQNQIDNGDINLPLILTDDESKHNWLTQQFDKEFPSLELDDRHVSKLSLNNSLYNGNRCLDEYTPFQLHTTALHIAEEEYQKVFGKNINWFDES